jgi:hypothetical protein
VARTAATPAPGDAQYPVLSAAQPTRSPAAQGGHAAHAVSAAAVHAAASKSVPFWSAPPHSVQGVHASSRPPAVALKVRSSRGRPSFGHARQRPLRAAALRVSRGVVRDGGAGGGIQ